MTIRKVIDHYSMGKFIYYLVLECKHEKQIKTYTMKIPNKVKCDECSKDKK